MIITSMRYMSDLDVTVDPIVVTSNTTGQVATAPADGTITGDKPPLIPPAWWPWILLFTVGAAVWWLNQESENEKGEGRGVAGPLLG